MQTTTISGFKPFTVYVTGEFIAIYFCLSLRKLDHPHIAKFYGTALLRERGTVRMILVMEKCKGNLSSHISEHPESVPESPEILLTSKTCAIGQERSLLLWITFISRGLSIETSSWKTSWYELKHTRIISDQYSLKC